MKPPLIAHALFLGVFATCAAFGQTSNPAGVQAPEALPKITPPSGPFGIGRVGYHWVDASRPDPYSTEPNAHRELMVYSWYPTLPKAADTKGPYLPGAERMDALPEVQGRMRREFGAKWPAMVAGRIFSHAVQRAPVAKDARRFPVVVFSHGLGSTGFNYTCLVEDLVSRG